MPVSSHTNSITALSASAPASSRIFMVMEPFSLLYLTALLMIFMSSLLTCSGLPIRFQCTTLYSSCLSVMPCSKANLSMTVITSSMVSCRLNGRLSNLISPDSSLPISSTSLISSSSRFEASLILVRHSVCLSRSSA